MDFERISLLLHIVEKAQGHPTLTTIRDEALKELQKHNDWPAERLATEQAGEPEHHEVEEEPAHADA